MAKVPAQQSSDQLAALAEEIREHAALCEQSARTTLEHARAIGERLVTAKDLTGHGKWTAWVKDNVPFSMATAERMMHIHREWDRLKSAPVRILGVKDAIAYLAAEKKKAKPSKPRVRNDDDAGEARAGRDAIQSNVKQDVETVKAKTGKVICPNCGCDEIDEDGDCAHCREPRVHSRATANSTPGPEDEADSEVDSSECEDDEPQAVRDYYVDPGEADFFHPEEPFDEDTVDYLEVLIERMERPLSQMLEHEAVTALSECNPLRVSLFRLERAIEQVSADLARKRPVACMA